MKAVRKLLMLFVVSVGFLLLMFCGPELLRSQILYPYLSGNVFRVFTGTGTGTAFQVNYGDDYLVTASHVCKNSKSGMLDVEIGPDEYKKVIILANDESHDVCIAESVKSNGLFLNKIPMQFSDVFTFGFPLIDTKQFYSGKLLTERTMGLFSGLVRYEHEAQSCQERNGELRFLRNGYVGCFINFQLYDTTFFSGPEISGAPTFNQYGQVVGIVVGMNELSTALIVDIKYLKQLIKKYESEDPAKKKDK